VLIVENCGKGRGGSRERKERREGRRREGKCRDLLDQFEIVQISR